MQEQMIRAYFTIPEGVNAKYQEQDGNYYSLTNVFGSETGFPVMDFTSNFKATFDTAGEYTITVEFKKLDGTVLATKDIVATVVTPVVPVIPATSSGGGGGHRGSRTVTNNIINNPNECIKNWVCGTVWTTCIDGVESKVCLDSNNCKANDKLLITQGCSIEDNVGSISTSDSPIDINSDNVPQEKGFFGKIGNFFKSLWDNTLGRIF